MLRFLTGAGAVVAAVLLGGVAVAQMGQGPHPMGGGMGPGMMGPMMGAAGCPGMMTGTTATQPSLTEEKAKVAAREYANKYLKGFTVEKVLPFTGMHGTMYSVELKGPNEEVRTPGVGPVEAIHVPSDPREFLPGVVSSRSAPRDSGPAPVRSSGRDAHRGTRA